MTWQQPDQLRSRIVALVGVGLVALTIGLVVVAWLLVVPAPVVARPADHVSPLEHELYDRATAGHDAAAAGARQLERYEWVDRHARIVRIPIDRAIDAVVADPTLIDARRNAVVIQ